jgi:hypothetical protein
MKKWVEMNDEERKEFMDGMSQTVGEIFAEEEVGWLFVVLWNTDKGHQAEFTSNLTTPAVPQVLRDVAETIEVKQSREET